MCVCERERESKRERLLDALNVHVIAHVDVCFLFVCVCVCVRERERGRQIDRSLIALDALYVYVRVTNSIRCFVCVCKAEVKLRGNRVSVLWPSGSRTAPPCTTGMGKPIRSRTPRPSTFHR